MESVLKLIKKPESEEEQLSEETKNIVDEIRKVCHQMTYTNMWFQMESDADLIDACIYQMEALNAKYRYLMKKAKNNDIYFPPFKAKCL